MGKPLADGLYEHLITRGLADDLAALEPTRGRSQEALEPAEASALLARHVAAEVMRALELLPKSKTAAPQVEITNQLLHELQRLIPKATPGLIEAAIGLPGEQLLSVFHDAEPSRPQTPLATSTLLTRAPNDPSIGAELAHEITSADRVDILIAFITVGGVRVLRDALESFARRGTDNHNGTDIRLRILTTVFTGTTEVAAIESLAKLPGARVKVSYDVRRTRLHAKAWLFHRNSGLHTAYIGSANFTKPALADGHEWMVKVCAADLPQVIEKFRGTFEALWNDPEFEDFDPAQPSSRQRLQAALSRETQVDDTVHQLFTLRPFPFQQEILDRLEVERVVHGRHRNLVVAATGTGKTVVAAFDYLRMVEQSGTSPRMLFVAHRRELLDQARSTFRHVLRNGAFGELLLQGKEPERWEHVFATIQSAASQKLLERFGPTHFKYVVVDECHHAPADSYRALVPHLRPEILLGLTATPERTDGKPLLPDFDGHIAAELRIWHALERQLLVPFEYYGISDNTDLTRIRWSRTGYDAGQLEQLYTGNDARVDLVLKQLSDRVASVSRVRALAFCVSVEHAEFMARALQARGVKALAIHGGTPDEVRSDAPRRLREREINVLCTCDLYNEGVDLPFVDTLLFLRPTASATLFLQQLGRGLRHDAKKDSCLVLDFIGQHRAEFRFDATLCAFTGVPRARLAKALEHGFPFLPSGCVLQLDSVARAQILGAVKTQLARRARVVAEVRELSAELGKITLCQFLAATGREIEEVYGDKGGWTTLKHDAGVLPAVDASVHELSRRLGWLAHVDEPARLALWKNHDLSRLSDSDRVRYTMLGFQLEEHGTLKTAEQVAAYVRGHTEIAGEIAELSDALDERIAVARDVYPVEAWPLALHRHYSRREILAAVGYVKPGDKASTPQSGILKLDAKRELLLVTLDKSASSFSPSTRYRDYAISPSLFHWETQSIASVSRESGQRYIESPGNGWSFYLFVRTDPDATYAFAGPARHVSHLGDRPIAITWQLEHDLPAMLYQRYATLAQG